jgi:alpha-glucosidase (family GH31 glycosyl hydrolase)
MIPAALSFGLSGFPFWHAEVAGYVEAGLSRDQTRELWLRWLQLGTWTAMLRDHLGDHPSMPMDAYSDEGTLIAFREAARIHNSLVPYLYSLAVDATRTGLPMLRYMPLEVPDDPRAWQEEQSYFLGPVFLVAPVVRAGATSRTAYLPVGEWVDYWTDTTYSGGQEVTVAAPLAGGRAPVFVRAGSMLPLAPDFDTLAPSSTPGVRTYTGDLLIKIAPGAPRVSTFTLYDGTLLDWSGSALEVRANAQPRTIELRLPDGRVVNRRVEGAEALIAPA